VAEHVDADRHLDHHARHALAFVQADILAPLATSWPWRATTQRGLTTESQTSREV
jgi:hypothetical protein